MLIPQNEYRDLFDKNAIYKSIKESQVIFDRSDAGTMTTHMPTAPTQVHTEAYSGFFADVIFVQAELEMVQQAAITSQAHTHQASISGAIVFQAVISQFIHLNALQSMIMYGLLYMILTLQQQRLIYLSEISIMILLVSVLFYYDALSKRTLM